MITNSGRIKFKIVAFDTSYQDETWSDFEKRIENLLNEGFIINGGLKINYIPQPSQSEGYNIYSYELIKGEAK